MSKVIGGGSFIVALSLLLGCGDAESGEDFGESSQAFVELPLPIVFPSLPVAETIATNVRATSIALDSSNVYCTDTFNLTAEVASRPLDGGDKTVLHTTYTVPSSLVRFGTALYWVDFSISSEDAGVWSAPTSGSRAAVKLLSRSNPVTAHRALDVYSSGSGLTYRTHVLYADAWASKLYELRLSLFASSARSLIPDAVLNYYPYSVAIDSTHVYFTHDAGRALWRVPFAGGVPTELEEGVEPGPLVVTGGQVYFVEDGDLKTKPATGGASATFVERVGTVAAMVAANGYLYWACSSCGTIRRKALAGGSTKLLAVGQAGLRSLAVNATHVYFGTDTALKRAEN